MLFTCRMSIFIEPMGGLPAFSERCRTASTSIVGNLLQLPKAIDREIARRIHT